MSSANLPERVRDKLAASAADRTSGETQRV